MKDYAKKSLTPPKASREASQTVSNLTLLLAIVFAITAAYHFVEKRHLLSNLHFPSITLPHEKYNVSLKQKVQKRRVNKMVLPQPTNTTDTQPQYDFYKLLPETTVTVPQNSPPPITP